MNNFERLALLLFPSIEKTPEDYEEIYPPRQLPDTARVTRFAPSPTGSLHIGGLFAAMIARLTAKNTDGVFYLRIEDTDKKREIDDGVSEIIKGLDDFGVTFDEGMTGKTSQSGDYGPYIQSKRRDIYQCFAKELVKNGLAYPCFCTSDELNSMRETQEKDGTLIKGYFGKWAKCRDLTIEEVEQRIAAGETYVMRLRSPGSEDGRVIFDDLIKGKIEMAENVHDVVILKADGIPTYHFAHAVDDHLMRTTHVVRGDEWVASVPTHIQLFKACGFRVPKYAHFAPIMKEDISGKRKLSKRRDPEAAVSYYSQQGYPQESVTEYLLTIANSNFEDWRAANKNEDNKKFPFNLKKMSPSGALFDLNKLNDVSKNIISLMDADTVYDYMLEWSESYDEELGLILSNDSDYAIQIFSIDRGTGKPRKDIAKWSEMRDYISYFYDELFVPDYTLDEKISPSDAAELLKMYLVLFDDSDNKDTWFDKIKSICQPLGFTPNVKEYKQNPEQFKGHVGDVSGVIRMAVTGRKNTPDLHSIMNLLGEERVRARIKAAINEYEE